MKKLIQTLFLFFILFSFIHCDDNYVVPPMMEEEDIDDGPCRLASQTNSRTGVHIIFDYDGMERTFLVPTNSGEFGYNIISRDNTKTFISRGPRSLFRATYDDQGRLIQHEKTFYTDENREEIFIERKYIFEYENNSNRISRIQEIHPGEFDFPEYEAELVVNYDNNGNVTNVYDMTHNSILEEFIYTADFDNPYYGEPAMDNFTKLTTATLPASFFPKLYTRHILGGRISADFAYTPGEDAHNFPVSMDYTGYDADEIASEEETISLVYTGICVINN